MLAHFGPVILVVDGAFTWFVQEAFHKLEFSIFVVIIIHVDIHIVGFGIEVVPDFFLLLTCEARTVILSCQDGLFCYRHHLQQTKIINYKSFICIF